MMNNFVVKRYNSANDFLFENGESLQKQEIENSFLLTELRKDHAKSACSAVLDKSTGALIFGLFATESLIYASDISAATDTQFHASIVDLLVKDFLSASFSYKGFRAYEPVLTLFHESMKLNSNNSNFELKDDMWSYVIEKIKWSPRALEIKDSANFSLRQASMEDFQLLIKWTQGFFHDDSGERLNESYLEQLCIEELKEENVYILYNDEAPVCMGTKRRPLRDGCALSLVYTPPEHRQRGYGGACVSLITHKLLKEFQYVTLFVNATVDSTKNMYISVGYTLFKKAGQYVVSCK